MDLSPKADPPARTGAPYRAALEGTAFGVRHNLAAMAEAGGDLRRALVVGGDLRRLVVVGGGARELWTQIVSDVTGLEQEIPRHTPRGCVRRRVPRFAGGRIGRARDIAGWNPVESVDALDAGRVKVYDELYAHYRARYPATREVSHTLACPPTRRRGLRLVLKRCTSWKTSPYSA